MKLKLKSNPDNPRTISKDAYQRLKKKIEKNPKGLEIHRIAHRDGIIIAGNQRWRVINDLKLELKPEWFYDLNGWSDQEVTDWLIDSNISDGEWDVDMLYNQYEPEYLLEHGIDLPYDTSSQEIEEDEAPEADEKETPKSKLGEVYQLGRHKVMCGSATSLDDVSSLLGEQRVDLLVTDPPYNVDYEGGTGLKIMNDKMDDEQFQQFLTDANIAIDSHMKQGASFYIFHADSEGYNFRASVKGAGWLLKQCLIWVKQSMVMGRQDYQWQHEPILYGWKSGASHSWYSDRKQTTKLEFDRPSRNAEHPTMKPLNILAYLIQNSSKAGDLVFDSFLGSGSTLIACEQTDRTCYGMELDEKYLDVIRKRYAKFTSPDDTLPENWEELTPKITG